MQPKLIQQFNVHGIFDTMLFSENCVKDDDQIPNGYISGPGVLKTGLLWEGCDTSSYFDSTLNYDNFSQCLVKVTITEGLNLH